MSRFFVMAALLCFVLSCTSQQSADAEKERKARVAVESINAAKRDGEFHILVKNREDEDAGLQTSGSGDAGTDEIEELDSTEKEASYVADQIASLIGTTYHNGKEGRVRKVEPRDIVILLIYAAGKAEIFYNALRVAYLFPVAKRAKISDSRIFHTKPYFHIRSPSFILF